MSRDAALDAVDAALVRLRRLWSGPPAVVDDEGRQVEMSSLLVVECCARRAASGQETAVGDVAAFADVTPSTASRLVDRAVAAGLLLRTPYAQDRRRTVLTLTPAGAALRERAVGFRLHWLRATVAQWSGQDVATFSALLTRFADNVAGLGGPDQGPGDGLSDGSDPPDLS